MGYCSASDVSAICLGLLGGEEGFSTSTSPTLDQVNRWITSGCAVIETRLQGAGYSVPPGSTTSIYEALKDLNALYSAARAEMSRINAVLAPGMRTRGQLFRRMFWEELAEVLSMDLTQAGMSKASTAVLYAGGISEDDKQTVEAGTDRVEPRFGRAIFDYPGTTRADTTTTAS